MSRILNRDLMLEIARGNAPGLSSINKFGANLVSADGVREDIWDGGGTYTWPTSATITVVRSAVDSVLTRNKTIEVQGLDTNWDFISQEVITANTSTFEVTLGTALIRCFRVRAQTNDVLDEDIWVGPASVAAGTAKAIMTAGNNQTLMALYTVPNGYTGFITSYYCDYVRTAAKDPNGLEYGLWMADRDSAYEFQLKHEKGIPKQASGFQHHFAPYLKATQKTDIKVTALSEGADAHVHAGFDIILVKN